MTIHCKQKKERSSRIEWYWRLSQPTTAQVWCLLAIFDLWKWKPKRKQKKKKKNILDKRFQEEKHHDRCLDQCWHHFPTRTWQLRNYHSLAAIRFKCAKLISDKTKEAVPSHIHKRERERKIQQIHTKRATQRGVWPFLFAWSILEPFSNRNLTTSKWPIYRIIKTCV